MTPLAQIGQTPPSQSSPAPEMVPRVANRSGEQHPPPRVAVKDLMPSESKPEDIHKLMQSVDMDQIKKKIDRQPKPLQQASLQLVKDLQTQYQKYQNKLPLSNNILNSTYKGQVAVESQIVHETESRMSFDMQADSVQFKGGEASVRPKELSFPSEANDLRRNPKYNFQQGDGVMRFTKGPHNMSVSKPQPSNFFSGGDSDGNHSGERELTMGFFSGRTKVEPSPLQVGPLEHVLFSP